MSCRLPVEGSADASIASFLSVTASKLTFLRFDARRQLALWKYDTRAAIDWEHSKLRLKRGWDDVIVNKNKMELQEHVQQIYPRTGMLGKAYPGTRLIHVERENSIDLLLF